MAEWQRSYPGDPHVISEMRKFTRHGCCQAWPDGEDETAIAALELAVSEVASNIILHGLQHVDGEQIRLILSIENDRACVTFVYPGCAFDPDSVPAPDFSSRATSGYGLYLIRRSVDDIQFSRDESGACRILLIKQRR